MTDAGVFVVDTDDRIRDCNDQARTLFGLGDEPVVGTAVSDLLARFPEVERRYGAVSETDHQATEQFASVVSHALRNPLTVATQEAVLRDDATGTVDADRTQLLWLLENSFRNAVEHSGETVRVTSVDDGPGIPEQDRESVLEQGYTTATENGSRPRDRRRDHRRPRL